MVSMVNGVRPRNEIEAAFAAQMVAVHLLTMRCAHHALRNEDWLDPLKTVAVANGVPGPDRGKRRCPCWPARPFATCARMAGDRAGPLATNRVAP